MSAAPATLVAELDRYAPTWVSPPLLQPSRFYLELLGEDLRARAFLTTDENGQELCLRPDITAPACRIAMREQPVLRRVAYHGRVFRRRGALSPRETEFDQIGIEALDPPGATAPAILEADLIVGALAAVRAGGFEPALKLGHAGVFAAFCNAVGLAPAWVAKLLHAAGRPGLASATLANAARGGQAPSPLARALAGLEPDAAVDALSQLLEAARINPVGSRPVSAIAARLQAQAQFAAVPTPSASQCELLGDVLSLSAPASEAFSALEALAKKPDIKNRSSVLSAIAVAHELWSAVKSRAELPQSVVFAPGLGRTVWFYDGFVFDLAAPALGDRESLGGGGRYDGLIRKIAQDIGAENPDGWRACGFALRPERIAEAAGARS
jgi:ATP phosphoribosyltransferase regulatory subunit